jgi:hypothetical protein
MQTPNTDPIASALDITPLQAIIQPPKQVQKIETKNSDDYEYARTNMYDIIEKGQEALVGILDVANMSQHPRSYEVAANLIKTLSEVNKDLLQLAKTKKEIDKEDGVDSPQKVTNNLFVGSTADLLKTLKHESK